MRMRMILKRKELKINDERAVKTPQGGDDRENSCLGKLPGTRTAHHCTRTAHHCTKTAHQCTITAYSA